MSGMDGNPYVTTELETVAYEHDSTAAATLALAYEQRTANLIALFQWHDAQGDLTETTNDLYREIIARTTSTEAQA